MPSKLGHAVFRISMINLTLRCDEIDQKAAFCDNYVKFVSI